MWIILIAFLASWSESSIRNTRKPPGNAGIKPIQIKAGILKGVVKGYTGKPFARTSIELLNSGGKSIAKTVTNSRGEYLFRNIPPGKYTAVVGGRTRLPITMTKEASVSRLMIVPSFKGAAPGATLAGLSTWTWVAIGGGVAAAVAIPVAIGSSGSSSKSAVSP